MRESVTETQLSFEPRKSNAAGIQLAFFFHNAPQPQFEARIKTFLESITDIFPFLPQLNLVIRTQNSFPHSAGIASSASAMSAIALCLCSLEHHFFNTLEADTTFRQKASFVARLGSGSACRSIFAKAGFWGKHGEMEGSTDEYAVSAESVLHPVFQDYCNTILIVNRAEKSVSSTAGHALMEHHPYADVRYDQATLHIHHLLTALRTGDVEEFGRITENEALTLHALMMASNPSYILLQPTTLTIIDELRRFRADTSLPVCFSLDAGPNPHILYPQSARQAVEDFIHDKLLQYCADGKYIADGVGEGPEEIV